VLAAPALVDTAANAAGFTLLNAVRVAGGR